MDNETYALINGPVAFVSLLTVCFFCSCLLVENRDRKDGVRQPLRLLLWSLLGWNGCLQLTMFLSVCVVFSEKNMSLEFLLAKWFILKFSILLSLSPTAWLSVYYHVRIVPSQRAFFLWMKRNIKPVVYWGLAVDRVFTLSDGAIGVMQVLSKKDKRSAGWGQNGSFPAAPLNGSGAGKVTVLDEVILVSSWIEMVYFLLCLIVMTSCSGTTVQYLWTHIKRMQATPPGGSFSSPRLQSQWRVTVTGSVQGGLYVFCLLWIFLDCYLILFPDLDSENHILCTIICLFSFATMVNLGLGQTLFRRRLVDLRNRAVQRTQLCGFNKA